MDAKILTSKPISGEYPEVLFDAYGNCVWVKFVESSLSQWCGVFGCGEYGETRVLVRTDIGASFVLASGQGYWVHVEDRRCLGKTKRDDFQVAIWPNDCEFVIAATWTNILFLNWEGTLWDSGRVSYDGISLDSYSEGILRGWVNDLSDDGCEFTLDVSARKVVGAPKFPEGAA